MNKLWGEAKDGGKILICVLEPGNIRKLVGEKQPIQLDLNDGPYAEALPARLSVVIHYSDSPVADARAFAELVRNSPNQGKPGGVSAPRILDRQIIDQRTPKIESSKPHCPECKSTIEQLGVWRSDTSPVWIAFCPVCGCTLGVTPALDPLPGMERKV